MIRIGTAAILLVSLAACTSAGTPASKASLPAPSTSATTKAVADTTEPPTTPATAAPTAPATNADTTAPVTEAPTTATPTTVAPTDPPTTPAPTDPPTTTEPPSTTTTLPVTPDGVYLVNTDFVPGLYRVGQYYERLAADGSIIANDITSDCPTLVDVLPTDDQIKITGSAVPVSLEIPFDPIAHACTDGTFIVGLDIQPGRYKVLPSQGSAYWARLDRKLDTIKNDIGEGQLIVTIQPGDFAIKISGTLSPA